MSTTDSSSRWSATAEVVPRDGNTLLGTASGAYVAVVGLAPTESAFRAGIERAMNSLEFDLVGLENVKQLRSPRDARDLDPVLRERLEALRDDNPVEVGNFHAFSD